MKLTNVQHIFFDLDHTLWDFERNSALAFGDIFKNMEIALDLDGFLSVYKPINFKYWALYRNNQVTKEALRYGRLKESFDELAFELSDDSINSLAEDYINFLPNNNHLLEGSKELLDYLKPNYKLHIITNGFEEIQHLKMKNAGIIDYFESITTSEEAGVKKPHRQIFKTALEKSGALSSHSVMVGDNFEADVEGAHKFGLRAIYLNPDETKSQSEYMQVKKLKELLNYF